MSFTSLTFILFFIVTSVAHWLIRSRRWQNLLLLAASYVFVGYSSLEAVAILAAGTAVDALATGGMVSRPQNKKALLWVSLATNLGMLLVFKYFNFFAANVTGMLAGLGLETNTLTLKMALPLGISFYTLKKIAYVVVVYRGTLTPDGGWIDFALYVAFFPQFAAGPIDRPNHLLAQFSRTRTWHWENFFDAWQLLVTGVFKKLVIADTVANVVERIFLLEAPSIALLLVGGLGFTLQVLADFSAYTDLSRGVARLLGIESSPNFNAPYLAVSPSDFWNRWHMTLTAWLKEHIFFPLRRALARRELGRWRWLAWALPPLVTMLASGFWHGTGWTYILWGLYYGVLIVIYHALGLQPERWSAFTPKRALAWVVMFGLTVFGWLIFRAPSLKWLGDILTGSPWLYGRADLVACLSSLSVIGVYALPLLVYHLLDRWQFSHAWLRPLVHAASAALTIIYLNAAPQDFIYFQF
ncbi:MAG: MBOAT family protein [Anaerolineae bacterium]|nr:MBOAT family protein [Anaerolineae bacterium]